MPSGKACKDCGSTTRALNNPGPRCTTCHREKLKRDEDRDRDRRYRLIYGISLEIYNEIYAFQGGRCAICRWATGKTKKLAVEHDHATGEVRGLACGPCNRMLGQSRDNPEFFDRAADYLRNPPYQLMKEARDE